MTDKLMEREHIFKERGEEKYKRPRKFNVILLNDDFTPMDFVVHVLRTIFKKSESEAERITMEVHTRGRGVAGTYTYEIAETKCLHTMTMAGREGHPLQADTQPAE